MLNKRKFLIKLCAALPAALLLTTTPVLADENDAETIELCRALLKKEHWNVIANILKQLNENGVLDNPEKVRYTVLSYMNTVLLSGKENAIAMMALEAFSQDTFNTGKAGITLACLKTIL